MHELLTCINPMSERCARYAAVTKAVRQRASVGREATLPSNVGRELSTALIDGRSKRAEASEGRLLLGLRRDHVAELTTRMAAELERMTSLHGGWMGLAIVSFEMNACDNVHGGAGSEYNAIDASDPDGEGDEAKRRMRTVPPTTMQRQVEASLSDSEAIRHFQRQGAPHGLC